MYTIHPEAEVILQEKPFYLFKHAGLFCAISRMASGGNLNGYVAVPQDHSLYEKDYMDKVVVPDVNALEFNGNYMGLLCVNPVEANANIVSLDMAIKVYCGLTYSDNQLYNIETDLLGPLWWFGFDTAHSGDLRPIQDEISRKYPHRDDTYKDFDFVMGQVKSLAEQLSKF